MMTRKFFLPLNLQFFAADPGTVIGGSGEPEPGANEPTPQGSGNPEPTPTPEPTPEPPVKKVEMTQEEIDAIVEDRLKRERKKYADYDTLLDFKKQADEKAEEERKKNMSEIERIQEEARLEREKREQAEKELANQRETNKRNAIINEFIKVATAKNVMYIDDAIKLADSDLSKVELDEAGRVVGVDAVVASLVESKPYLLKKVETDPKSIGGPSNPNPADEVKTIEQQLEEAKKAKNFSKVIALSNQLKNLLK